MKKTGPWLLILALLAGVHAYKTRSIAKGSAPALDGALLDGAPFTLAVFEGQRAIVYFWASWCGICRSMEDTITSIAKDFPVVSVALRSGNAEQVARYVEQVGLTVPVILDETGRIGKRYGIPGVPAVFILDGSGEIVFSSIGYTSELGIRLRLWLAQFA